MLREEHIYNTTPFITPCQRVGPRLLFTAAHALVPADELAVDFDSQPTATVTLDKHVMLFI